LKHYGTVKRYDKMHMKQHGGTSDGEWMRGRGRRRVRAYVVVDFLVERGRVSIRFTLWAWYHASNSSTRSGVEIAEREKATGFQSSCDKYKPAGGNQASTLQRLPENAQSQTPLWHSLVSRPCVPHPPIYERTNHLHGLLTLIRVCAFATANSCEIRCFISSFRACMSEGLEVGFDAPPKKDIVLCVGWMEWNAASSRGPATTAKMTPRGLCLAFAWTA
jgi:hypothetical protein